MDWWGVVLGLGPVEEVGNYLVLYVCFGGAGESVEAWGWVDLEDEGTGWWGEEVDAGDV